MSSDRRAQDHGSDLRPIGLGKQPPTQGSRADRVGLIDDQAPSDVEPGGRQAEGETQQEREQGECSRHHLADRGPVLLLRTPSPIRPHPEAALERQEDDHDGGQVDAPDRQKIEPSSVSLNAPVRSALGKSRGHYGEDMVLPSAEIQV